MKKVSIIIPVYNVEKYLVQCLDSIGSQTYQNLEIILVNDGSKDLSGQICDRYAEQDSRVCVIHQENAGAANAKNAGLDRATGQYIAFADSDDYVEPSWIEKMVAVAESFDADVVECDFDKVYQSHCETENCFPDECTEFTAEEYLGQYLSNWTCSLFWNKLFCAKRVKSVRFRKERRCIDDEFFTYKAITGAQKVVRIQDVLYHYRQRASSAVSTAKNRVQIADDAVEILLERYRWIKRYYPKLQKSYLTHDVEIMLYFAKEFEFLDETQRKFRKIARFYLKECLLVRPSLATFHYAIRLQRIALQTVGIGEANRGSSVCLEDYYS